MMCFLLFQILTWNFHKEPPGKEIIEKMTSIATLGSHCALQVLKGAKDEGFKTILVCETKREKLYRRFSFIDELILVDSFKEILDQKYTKQLEELNAIIIPHGTLIAQ